MCYGGFEFWKNQNQELCFMKVLVNFICCFVPKKKWRKQIRLNLISKQQWRKDLLDRGFTINNEIITTPEGVNIEITKNAECLYVVREVFVKSEYNLNLKRESVLIDIGMNRGGVSLLFATKKHVSKIYAYEPFRPTFEMAIRNLELNPQLSKKIVPHNFGLGGKEATMEISYLGTAAGRMSTTRDRFSGQRNVRKESVLVKDAAKELLKIFEQNGDKHIIVKCDCEGAEFEIFERLNAEHLVGKIDVVMMECHFEPPDKILDILTQNGFAAQVRPGSAVPSKPKTGFIYAVRMAEKNKGT